MTAATSATSAPDLLYTRPSVTVRRRVRPRPVGDIARLTHYRGGTYSHTVDRIVFTDGTWARTDLIRLNPGIEAYSLDFTGVAPTRPSRYEVDTWSAVPNLQTRAHEAEVDWILRNSVPRLTVAELSRRLRAAGVPLGRGNISEHEAIAGTQAAIWHLTNGLDLDTRPLNEPIAVRHGPDGVTVEFDGTPQLGGYTVELVAQSRNEDVTVTLHKSVDGRIWREVPSSRLTARGTGDHRKRLGVGTTVSAHRHGRAGEGHRFYRLTVNGQATVGDVGFWLDGSGTYRNPQRVVQLYHHLLDGARRARETTTAPSLSAAGAAADSRGLIGPFRLGATDAAKLSADNAVVVDASGAEVAGPMEPGSIIFLRPRQGQTSATVTMTVPGTEDGYGGRVLTGVARDEVSNTYTPLALAIPTELVVDFDIDWSR